MVRDCFLQVSEGVRRILDEIRQQDSPVNPNRVVHTIGRHIEVDRNITAIMRGTSPSLPFTAESRGGGRRRFINNTANTVKWFKRLADGIGAVVSDDDIIRVASFGLKPDQKRFKTAVQSLRFPTMDEIVDFVNKFPEPYRLSITNILVGHYINAFNWLHYQYANFFMEDPHIASGISALKDGIQGLMERLDIVVDAPNPLNRFEDDLAKALSSINRRSDFGERLTDDDKTEALGWFVRGLSYVPPEFLDANGSTVFQKRMRQALYFAFGRGNIDVPALYDALAGRKAFEDLDEATQSAFKRIWAELYPQATDVGFTPPELTDEEIQTALQGVGGGKTKRRRRRTPTLTPTPASEKYLELFTPPEDAIQRERQLVEGLVRGAYSPDELQMVAQWLRSRGVNIPDEATTNPEALYNAVQQHFDSGGRINLFGVATQPDPAVRFSDGGGRPPVSEPPAEPPVEPPSPPTPPAGALPPPSPRPVLKPEPFSSEVAQAFGAWTADSMVNATRMTDYLGRLTQLATSENITVRKLEKYATELIEPIQGSPSREILHQKLLQSEAFTIGDDGKVVVNRDYLRAERERLQQQNPFMLLMNNANRDGYTAWRMMFDVMSDGDESVLRLFDTIVASRLLMNPAVEHLEEIVLLIASHLGANEIADLLSKTRTFDDIEGWLRDTNRYALHSDIIRQLLAKNKVMYLGDRGWVSEHEWYDATPEIRNEIIRAIMDDDGVLNAFLKNFGFVEESEQALRTVLRTGALAPDGGLAEGAVSASLDASGIGGAFIRNPAVLQRVLSFATEYGLDPQTLITAGKILYEHTVQMMKVLDGVGLSYDTIPLLTPKGLGMDAVRSIATALRTVFEQRGKRSEDLYNYLESVLEKTGDTKLMGAEALKALMYGVSDDLKTLFGEAWSLATNYVFVVDRLYHKGLMMNLGDLAIPIIAHFSRVHQTPTGAVKFAPDFFSLTPTESTPIGLGALLEKRFGQSKERFFEQIMPYMPQEWQSLYYAYAKSKNAGHFEVYIPKIVADLLEGDEFAIKHPLEVANDLFKSVLVVYNPSAQIRNFLSNMMLMGHITEGGFFRNFGYFIRAYREIKQGGLFYEQLKALDPAFDLLMVHEVPKGAETLYITYNPYQSFFRKIANAKVLRWFHKTMAHSEAVAKYAGVRAFLENRYGAEWATRYTINDVLEGLVKVNEFLVDYRTVPPAIHYLRNKIGLFPFITFTYTIISSFLRNPTALGIEAMRTVRVLSTAHRVAQGLGLADLDENALLMDYQKKNPLVLKWLTDDGRLITMDFSFILPIGVFAPFLSASQSPSLTGKLISFMGDVGQQMGSILRPIIEVAVNKNFLTGGKIYEDFDPDDVKAQKVGAYLANIVPIFRQGIELAETMGFVSPQYLEIPSKTKAPVIEGDDVIHKLGNFMLRVMSMRGFAFQEVQLQQYKRLIGEAKDTISAMKKVIQHPNLSSEQKSFYYRQYAEELQHKIEDFRRQMKGYIVVPMYRGHWEPLNADVILGYEGDDHIPDVEVDDTVEYEQQGYTPSVPSVDDVLVGDEGGEW